MNDGYIAAAFDAEGSLTYHKRKNSLCWQLSIANLDLDWLLLIQQYLIGRGFHAKLITSLRQRDWGFLKEGKVYLTRLDEIARFLNEFPSLMPRRTERIAKFRDYNTWRVGSGGWQHEGRMI